MNEFKYIYTIRDDYYGFPGTYYEEILPGTVIFHGEMKVVDIQELYEVDVLKYIADSTRLYKIKEIK